MMVSIGPRLRSRSLTFLLSQFPKAYARLVAIRRRPDWEKLVFLRVIQRSDVVVDAGANRGERAVLFSHLVGASGRVHAFEPVADTFARLEVHAARGRFANLVLNRAALGDRAGAVEIHMPGDDDGQAALVPHRAGSWAAPHAARSYPVEMTTLDDYASGQLSRLDFLKCDVEGAELLVLRGGLQTLRALRPVLYLEVFAEWTADFGYQPVDILRLLDELGYRERVLVAAGLRLLGAAEIESAAAIDSVNLLCFVPELHAARLQRVAPWLGAR